MAIILFRSIRGDGNVVMISGEGRLISYSMIGRDLRGQGPHTVGISCNMPATLHVIDGMIDNCPLARYVTPRVAGQRASYATCYRTCPPFAALPGCLMMLPGGWDKSRPLLHNVGDTAHVHSYDLCIDFCILANIETEKPRINVSHCVRWGRTRCSAPAVKSGFAVRIIRMLLCNYQTIQVHYAGGLGRRRIDPAKLIQDADWVYSSHSRCD